MSTIKDFMGNATWRQFYMLSHNGYFAGDGVTRYSRKNYDDGGFNPIFVDANSAYAVQLNRHNDQNPYNVSVVYKGYGSFEGQDEFRKCTASTNYPGDCADRTLGLSNPFNPRYQYDWSKPSL
jgi:hypothetical protein